MKRLQSIIILITLFTVIGLAQGTNKVGKMGKISVSNPGADTIDVWCERYELVIADSSQNYFCWDACYPPFVGISNGTVPIAPGVVNTQFYTVYTPGPSGTSTIKYCFYIDGAPGDSACFVFSFDGNSPDTTFGAIAIDPTVGIEFIATTNRNKILDIHPNPARDWAALNYSLEHNVERGDLVVRNMLGSEVYRAELKGTVGQVIIPVEILNDGVYFCTMIVDNKVLQTKRLVVNH
ncbi:MAG: T9SS type A sorting domain-containing protein [Flavobacteriales bacterium]|nr:T9SS type A sorting domain-containing protein [Flavobacteriales bacterium]